jgi:hypothetical protein
MHRVELKVLPSISTARPCRCLKFLMHRVELKATVKPSGGSLTSTVPNAPCGVESAPFSVEDWDFHLSS